MHTQPNQPNLNEATTLAPCQRHDFFDSAANIVYNKGALGYRLTVGRLILDQKVGVRIPVAQPPASAGLFLYSGVV